MSMAGIYMIQSISNSERFYIGSSIDIGNRRRCHFSDLRLNKHDNIKLQRHFNKYGEGDLQFSIITICDREELKPIDGIVRPEQVFIWAYNPYFNVVPIAGNSLGYRHSEEAKQKMREKKLGHIPWNKGIQCSEETKQKISNSCLEQIAWNKGIPHSEETRQKLKIARRKRPLPSQKTKDKLKATWARRKQQKQVA